jgi:myosin tail region-interacting protein MTI1
MGTFTAAETGQPSVGNEGERVVTTASSPLSTVHGQHAKHATDDFGATQGLGKRASLTPALSADDIDISDDEMAPPRVTRPLPPDPPAPVSSDLAAAPAARAPPPPVPKRSSLPPPVRTVPVPLADSPQRVHGSSPQRAPIAKRASLAPPSREIPSPAPDSLDTVSSRPQPSTRRISLPPPTRPAPSPSVSREGSLAPPPPPPPPPTAVAAAGLSYSERDSQESGQSKEAPRIQDEIIAPPPHVTTPTSKPTIVPPTPDGRRIVESRRSTDSRSSHEERRDSAQYATLIPPTISGPISPPKKRVPSSLSLEKEILDDDIGGTQLPPYYGMQRAADTTALADPIDPRFHTPAKSPGIPQIPHESSPTSGTADPLPPVRPATPPAISTAPPPPANESGKDTLQRRTTIAERVAKLGGIKFGAPPPVNRVQPSAVPTQPAEDAGTEGSTAGSSGQPVLEEDENEEDEQARRQRIAAKIAGLGGMRVGMLPTQPVIAPVSTPPAPHIAVRPGEGATARSPPRDIVPPRRPAAYHHHESEQEYEQPSSSDDGVQVEAEESELEEVRHEELMEDEYDDGGVEEETHVTPPPPPPPRSTRPPVPTARPPIPLALQPGRSGSISTIMPVPRPPVLRQPASDFVMVEPEEAPLPSPVRHSRTPSYQWSPAPPPQPQESSDLIGGGQWELPSIPSGSLDLGNSVITGDLSGSMWSEDSTAYPPRPSISTPPPPPPTGAVPQQQHPRTPAAVPSQMTSEDLRALWGRVGVHVGEAATRLLERSKRTLVGNGSYEGFIAEALSQVPNALPPQRQTPGDYGILIYAQTAAQVHTRVTDILPGDVVMLDGAKLKGYKGLHTYSISAGEAAPCMGVVSEFDVKKLKLKALQANQRVGQAVRISLDSLVHIYVLLMNVCCVFFFPF